MGCAAQRAVRCSDRGPESEIERVLWAQKVGERVAARCRVPVDVDDFKQIAAMQAIKASRRYDPLVCGDFRLYAYRGVVGACLMSVRRRAFRELTHEQLDGMETVYAARCFEPAERRILALDAERKARMDLGDLQMNLLKPLQRNILRLHYFGGKTLGWTAHRLGISHTWAKIQHGRALKALRAGLEERGIRKVGDCL